VKTQTGGQENSNSFNEIQVTPKNMAEHMPGITSMQRRLEWLVCDKTYTK
jgi:hypothetical protein